MNFEPLSFLLERLFDLLKHEATILLLDEKEEIQSLQRELQLIESYLKDVDEIERQVTLNHVLQTKRQHLNQIIPEIEDFLDQLIDQKLQQAQKKKKNRFKSFFSPASNPLIRKHRLADRIVEIREQLSKALQRPEGYQLPNNYPQVKYRSRRGPTNPDIIKDEIIIGLDKDVDTLVAKFLGKDGEPGPSYSAIVGMGGSGKTTLAKLFYNHEKIKEGFPSRRAWVCVSQEWNARDLLLQICATLGVRPSEDERLIADAKLREFLIGGGDNCLVVLDDVWEKKALEELLPTLLVGNSRVLITTRKENIIRFPRWGACYVHRARRLTPEQSWELFSRIVGNGFEGSVNFEEDGDYEKLGREMLEKCDGLPLAIVALAGLLGTKSTIQKWENIKDRVVSMILRDDSEAVEKVLELSYSDLPYYLKPCFLYLGSFKEDQVILVNNLIDLWIREGFIKPDQNHESQGLEEVARNYLEELVQRCVVQAAGKDYSGDLISVRIHDLIRDLCINKADKQDFFQVLSLSTTTTTTTAYIKPSSYRAIYQDDYDRKSSLVLNNPRLRTLIYIRDASRGKECFGGKEYCIVLGKECFGGSSPSIKELFPLETFKQLRVLCLEGVALDDSANHIGNMVLLRCLRLKRFSFEREHVYFIKKLRNLETLVMDNRSEWYMTSSRPFDPSSISMLPENMVGSMDQLRVLELYLLNEGDRSAALSGVANLMKLQRLAQDPVCEELVKELQASNKDCLRALMLYEIRTQPRVDALCVCVSNNLPNLETLKLRLCGNELGFDQRKMKWGSCRALKELVLDGKILIIKQRESWSCPPKLLVLVLRGSKFEEEEDMVNFIAPLDHLRQLRLLSNTYYGNTLNMVGFPQLQKLELLELPKLKEWRITQGALPKLQHLKIISCKELERIPDGIRNIHTLQLLDVVWMPKEFCKRLVKREEGASEGGEDFHLVQHIPTMKSRHSN